MPMALEQFDLRGYDLVVSSEVWTGEGRARAFIGATHLLLPHADALHLGSLFILRPRMDASLEAAIFAPVSHYLRLWDSRRPRA